MRTPGDDLADLVPDWKLYVLLADGKPYFVGETRRAPQVRLREQARAGRLTDSYDVLTPKGGPTYLSLAQGVAQIVLNKLKIFPS